MSNELAKDLLEAIVVYNRVKNGDSGDAEHDAGVEMQNAAITYLRSEAINNVDLTDLVASFGDTLDEDVEEDEEE